MPHVLGVCKYNATAQFAREFHLVDALISSFRVGGSLLQTHTYEQPMYKEEVSFILSYLATH